MSNWMIPAMEITRYRMKLSYNDSYFGEPAGLLKSVLRSLDFLMPPCSLKSDNDPNAWKHVLNKIIPYHVNIDPDKSYVGEEAGLFEKCFLEMYTIMINEDTQQGDKNVETKRL